MKKTVPILIVALALAATFASAAPVMINALFMAQATAKPTSPAGTKEFEKANPSIKVALTFVPYEQLEEKIITSAQAGSYDVVLSDGPFTAKFAKAGIVEQVPALSAADNKDIFAGALPVAPTTARPGVCPG